MPAEDDEIPGLQARETARVEHADLGEARFGGRRRLVERLDDAPVVFGVGDEHDRPAVGVPGPDQPARRRPALLGSFRQLSGADARAQALRRLGGGRANRDCRRGGGERPRRVSCPPLADEDRSRRAAGIATRSARSAGQMKSPGYQPKARSQRRRRAGTVPPTCGRSRPQSRQYCWSGRRVAPQRGQLSSVPAIAARRSAVRPAGPVATRLRRRRRAERRAPCPRTGRRGRPAASGSSVRPQFGQKCEPRSTGAPHSHRGRWRRACSRSSISASRASIPTTAAQRSASRSSRNPPRRYISTSSPPSSPQSLGPCFLQQRGVPGAAPPVAGAAARHPRHPTAGDGAATSARKLRGR